ncbi:MAG: MGMT family protein [Candidatus Marsarchaeota archaeon]|jgi:methylated-DNA-[protein]-cysteine S-methyltransferase|nr:MGMT family protein [Candidatus Marsarchaeota archaeon]MCL5111312.1 MGMT family protein [Candidatus Marsarchaeota archaeon]
MALTRDRALSILKSKGMTDFQIKVLLATMRIPKGEVVTYKELARMIGRPKAYRAVGTALRNNPLAPQIPCHRVVRSDGSIGSYSAPGGTRKKRSMLMAEGAIK